MIETKAIKGQKINECGLKTAHAYVVLSALELSNEQRLVKVRNPWGWERYDCDYSDESKLWTPALREEAGATPEAVNEGIFFMKFEDYFEQGHSTIVSYDTTGWYRDHFLMLDDKTDSPGQWSWCGKTCTRHSLIVSSRVEQDVYLTVNLWEARSYPTECKRRNKYHSVYVEGKKSVDMWRDGSQEVKPIRMKANTPKKIMIEFDWARECVTPDWSLVAWGEFGEVSVKHS